jgi:hypothetical protein
MIPGSCCPGNPQKKKKNRDCDEAPKRGGKKAFFIKEKKGENYQG